MKKMFVMAVMLLSLTQSAFAAQPPRFPKTRVRVPFSALSRLAQVPIHQVQSVGNRRSDYYRKSPVVVPRIRPLPVIPPALRIPHVPSVSPLVGDSCFYAQLPVDTSYRHMESNIHWISPSPVFALDGYQWELIADIRQQYDFVVDGFAYRISPIIGCVDVAQWLGSEIDGSHVVVPDSVIWQDSVYTVSSIGPGAFCFNHTLTSVTVPSSVKIVMNGAFFCCTELRSITLESSRSMLLNRSISGCFQLREIKVPVGYKPLMARMYCSLLKLDSGCSQLVQKTPHDINASDIVTSDNVTAQVE